jgi:hypothetical protein
MNPARRLTFPLLLLVAAFGGFVDGAASSGLLARNAAAPLVLASLLGMAVCLAAASRSHRLLVLNATLAAAVVGLARLVVAAAITG